MKIKRLKPNTIIYHGTVHDFDPTELKFPAWFSFDLEQAHNHIAYKYDKNTKGKIHHYTTNMHINLIDISDDGDFHLYINEKGNKALADEIANGIYGDVMGYVNYPEQNEIMLCRMINNKQNIINYHKTMAVKLLHKVSYRRYGNDWRMKKNKKTNCCVIT
tara:strand:- start:300 stop:782 length:483 start_codon:yes stop_codon:yes gene_type:complete